MKIEDLLLRQLMATMYCNSWKAASNIFCDFSSDGAPSWPPCG